jgi:hypothetical protein
VPHRDFDAVRRSYTKGAIAPVEFTLAGERFTCLCDPTLGDTFELADAPDIDADDFDSANKLHVALIRKLADYIRRMLPDDGSRERWDKILYSIPVSHMPVVIEAADFITRQVIDRPTVPPSTSSNGRRGNGSTSRRKPAGQSRSR